MSWLLMQFEALTYKYIPVPKTHAYNIRKPSQIIHLAPYACMTSTQEYIYSKRSKLRSEVRRRRDTCWSCKMNARAVRKYRPDCLK